LVSYDGKQGLEAFRQARQRIDLVIVDWMMPHMNGEETLAEIHRLDSHVKSILLSGHVQGLDCIYANAILAKPVSIDSLLYTVQHLLAWEAEIPISGYGGISMGVN
jgi:DNA-binding response OmpR family regulator